jgi:hypothetical protein
MEILLAIQAAPYFWNSSGTVGELRMANWNQHLRRIIVMAIACCAENSLAIDIEVRLMCQVTNSCAPGNFFVDHPEALSALEFAVKAFEPFSDSLTAIPSSPSWTPLFTNPDTGAANTTVSNLSVAANKMILFAGGRDLSGNQVGEAGPGLANIVLDRGQGNVTGNSATDFATWGGAISFDTLNNGVPRKWHFGIHTSPGPGQVDFLTIAWHELAHVFGFGTAPSFDNQIAGQHFHGTEVTSLTGAPLKMTLDGNHWVTGTTSPPYADQPASALTASLVLGRRTPLTPLDYAALADIGWQVPKKLLGLHGDNDGNGRVDGRDFLIWQRQLGATGGSLVGDSNGDGMVDDFDLLLWRQNYGAQLAAGALTSNVQVPEPTAMVLAFMAMAAAGGHRPGTAAKQWSALVGLRL